MSMDLINSLQQKDRELSASIRELRNTGSALAEAERDYKIKLREASLQLRTEGMAVTLIDKVVYGVPEVAELRFKRDIAETIYNANQEAINSTKLQMRMIESQINREWSNTNG